MSFDDARKFNDKQIAVSLIDDTVLDYLLYRGARSVQECSGLTVDGKVGVCTARAVERLLTPSVPPWYTFARQEIGIKEIPGPKSHPRVLEYLRSTGLGLRDETPWCSAFVNFCVEQSGLTGTGKANARSWMKWGEECSFRPGCIVVLWRKGKNSPFGHVGFGVQEEGKQIMLLGGNQANRVGENWFPKHRVLGYRWSKF